MAGVLPCWLRLRRHSRQQSQRYGHAHPPAQTLHEVSWSLVLRSWSEQTWGWVMREAIMVGFIILLLFGRF